MNVHIESINPVSAVVDSETTPNTAYIVSERLDSYALKCTCKAFEFGNQKRPNGYTCKHILRVKRVIAERQMAENALEFAKKLHQEALEMYA